MRDWCLVIRASDTRINDYRAVVEAAPEAQTALDPIANHQPHLVTLSGTLIREPTKPVKIPWPGVMYERAGERAATHRLIEHRQKRFIALLRARSCLG